MGFKERLKEKRIEAGLTQVELAKKAGVTARTIQNYELGSLSIWRLSRKLQMLSELPQNTCWAAAELMSLMLTRRAAREQPEILMSW